MLCGELEGSAILLKKINALEISINFYLIRRYRPRSEVSLSVPYYLRKDLNTERSFCDLSSEDNTTGPFFLVANTKMSSMSEKYFSAAALASFGEDDDSASLQHVATESINVLD